MKKITILGREFLYKVVRYWVEIDDDWGYYEYGTEFRKVEPTISYRKKWIFWGKKIEIKHHELEFLVSYDIESIVYSREEMREKLEKEVQQIIDQENREKEIQQGKII